MTRSLVLGATILWMTAATAFAQPTITFSPINPNPGVSVTVTVTGTAGESFAVIGSTTWSGFAYAGVDLAVGTDVAILGTGVLNGSGQGTVSFMPPFPANDRFYVQAVTSSNGFATIAASLRGTVLNNQDARVNMPIGAAVRADGTIAAGSPGVSVSKAGTVYTISHSGLFEHFPIPNVTVTGNATISALTFTPNQTVVTLSAAVDFTFTMQAIRR